MKNVLFLLSTVFCTVFAQLVFKAQAGQLKLPPVKGVGDLWPLAVHMFRPWMLAAFAALFLGTVTWQLAMRAIPLTQGYMWIGLTFALVIVGGAVCFKEPVSGRQMLGCALIIVGVLLGGKA
jgi:multidrug transporter EmrE-like cation transporter